MLNHPVTGLTNASEWRYAELLAESSEQRSLALCPTPVRRAFRQALLDSLRIEQRMEDVCRATHLNMARVGRSL